MQVPSIIQGDSLKRLLQGATVGAVATMVVGFTWGGWSLGSTADKMAKERSDLAVVAALAPVCADKFRALPDAAAKTIALSKVDAWNRREEFPREFWTKCAEFGIQGLPVPQEYGGGGADTLTTACALEALGYGLQAAN